MKKILLLAAVVATGLFTACEAPTEESTVTVNVETTEPQTNNYFVLNRNVQQLKAIGKAAGELAQIDGETYGSFEVVICGNAVKDLADAEIMAPYMEILNANGVQVIACGFSLKKFEVDAASLPEGVTVVDNGILYGFEQQKAGVYSITL